MWKSLLRRTSAVLLASSIAGVALGEPLPHATPRGMNPEMLRALDDVRRQYGNDAVMIEGFLMGHAIENGSVQETAVSVVGFEGRKDKKYLVFKLETGIVYNDRELDADARLGRTWTRIVERTLRRFSRIDVPADGLGFVVRYAHKPYIDEADLRSHLREAPGEPEDVTFYLMSEDVTELMASRMSGQQLVDKADVSVNGDSRRVLAEKAEPTPAEQQPQ